MRWIKLNRQEGCMLRILTPLSVIIITAIGWATQGSPGAVGGFFIGLGLAILLPQLMFRSRNPRSRQVDKVHGVRPLTRTE